MNWPISIYLNLKRKPLRKFLIFFSLCTPLIAGMVWATCGDYGYDAEYSAFAPEYFVNKAYTPFFYEGYSAYYSNGDQRETGDDNNTRYNEQIVAEWHNYFNHQFEKKTLRFLLLEASTAVIDSVQRKRNVTIQPAKKSRLTEKQLSAFFNYLHLAKMCEQFTVSCDQYYTWDRTRPLSVPPMLEHTLLNAFEKETDRFIKARLWFQLVRYYYYLRENDTGNVKSPNIFFKYKDQFPKDLIFYRTMGYVAGYYYHQRNYALSNYLYSRCYDYCQAMKIPSKWSFHWQEEKDWAATLELAKNSDEKITLWHLLGVQYDEGRAIREIAAINPRSDKLDLLLSRVINIREANGTQWNAGKTDSLTKNSDGNRHLIESIADQNSTAKPYFWNLAAGYLNFLDRNYAIAGKFYALAGKQLPAGDCMVLAQYKLLSILLDIKRINHIDDAMERQLTSQLNWLADLRDQQIKVHHLRFNSALSECADAISQLYRHQKEPVKQVCFNSFHAFYFNRTRVERLVALLNKTGKTPFEQTMTRYYPYTLEQLYTHQAMMLVYEGQPNLAVGYLKKRKKEDFVFPGNPFNSRLNDCHDCDHVPQKRKLTRLGFLQILVGMQKRIQRRENIYRNAFLLATAYYNITFYGNARSFGESVVTNTVDTTAADAEEFTSMKLAMKYYLLARRHASGKEEKARCTFMLSKCERNVYYTKKIIIRRASTEGYHESDLPPAGQYFDELKNRYSGAAYYKEVLRECGYFKYYIEKSN